MSKPFLTIKDFTASLKEFVDVLKTKKTLVGIPQEDNGREQEVGPIGNAGLLYISEYGSPVNNIPARQPVSRGIQLCQKQLADEFEKCAKSAMSKGSGAINLYYERAGMIASNSIKNVITNQIGIAPPAPATLKARKYLTQGGFKGTKALLVTGQMRNAITYVVVDG